MEFCTDLLKNTEFFCLYGICGNYDLKMFFPDFVYILFHYGNYLFWLTIKHQIFMLSDFK